jgi:hypothetical protein
MPLPIIVLALFLISFLLHSLSLSPSFPPSHLPFLPISLTLLPSLPPSFPPYLSHPPSLPSTFLSSLIHSHPSSLYLPPVGYILEQCEGETSQEATNKASLKILQDLITIQVLHCTTLHYNTLHYTTLQCTALHYTALNLLCYSTQYYTELNSLIFSLFIFPYLLSSPHSSLFSSPLLTLSHYFPPSPLSSPLSFTPSLSPFFFFFLQNNMNLMDLIPRYTASTPHKLFIDYLHSKSSIRTDLGKKHSWHYSLN